jgi:hypothetical protein
VAAIRAELRFLIEPIRKVQRFLVHRNIRNERKRKERAVLATIFNIQCGLYKIVPIYTRIITTIRVVKIFTKCVIIKLAVA